MYSYYTPNLGVTVERVNDHVRRNPQILKYFILFEIEKGQSIWNTFENLCEMYRDDAMDYPEFEFWFMRFSRGEFDMNYDRSLDPKTRTFTDLPVHIFEKIAVDLSFSERLKLRDVCKSLQSVVDSWDPAIKTIEVDMWGSEAKVLINGDLCCISRGNAAIRSTTLFNRLKTILKNPKLQLNHLSIESFTNEDMEKFNAIFQSPHLVQIHVERFEIVGGFNSTPRLKQLLSIQHFKPGVLKKIIFPLCLTDDDYDEFNPVIKQIAQLEQFQNVETFKIVKATDADAETFEMFLHCPRFRIHLSSNMTTKQVLELIKTLMKSTVLESFDLAPLYSNDFNMKSLKIRLGSKFSTVEDRPNVRRHKVPNSDQFYEIELTSEKITINRVE